jgi:hypothetical protein
MLAYVFWHRSRSEVEASRYEASLSRFHHALREQPPSGFLLSRIHRLGDVPWMGGGPGYEDWYVLRDSAALDELNDAARDARRESAHDEAASLAIEGVAGLYRPLGEVGADLSPEAVAIWLDKPRSASYREYLADLRAVLPAGAELWQRAMVLGPTPEFCLITTGDDRGLSLPETVAGRIPCVPAWP